MNARRHHCPGQAGRDGRNNEAGLDAPRKSRLAKEAAAASCVGSGGIKQSTALLLQLRQGRLRRFHARSQRGIPFGVSRMSNARPPWAATSSARARTAKSARTWSPSPALDRHRRRVPPRWHVRDVARTRHGAPQRGARPGGAPMGRARNGDIVSERLYVLHRGSRSALVPT